MSLEQGILLVAIMSLLGILCIAVHVWFVGVTAVVRALQNELRPERQERNEAARMLRDEVRAGQTAALEASTSGSRELREAYLLSAGEIRQKLEAFAISQETRLKQMEATFEAMAVKTSESLERMRTGTATAVKELQEGNERKLEEMRVTVDEKLQSTLSTRLGESFKQVSDHLEKVQRGLGEMQQLATGVGDLRKALTNVKTRGVFGEYQLAALLEQLLSPDQYVKDYRPQVEKGEVVEFAVKFPGAEYGGAPVYLPIDSKFPQEDYLRLVAAYEQGDSEVVRANQAQLLAVVRKCALDIKVKYIHPPATTEFAVLFLPTEGLYAEVLRAPGVVEQMQREYRVTIAGPTTLAALLMSLRVGFRTIVLEKRSGEIWQMLGAVRTEFAKYGTVLDKLQKQLATATKTVDETAVRTRAMERKLRTVEVLPDADAERLLALPVASQDSTDEENRADEVD